MKQSAKKLSVFAWAFVALLTVFFAVGFATLGSFRSTGKSFVCGKGATVQYELEIPGDDKLDAVFVNAGLLRDESADITVKGSTSSSSSTASWTTLGTVELTDSAFNWVEICSGLAKSGVKRVSLTANALIDINEIVCLGESGETLLLSVSSKNPASLQEAYEAGIDAQNSFSGKTGAYNTFTQDESEILANAKLLLEGRVVYENGAYEWNGGFNYLATLLYLPFVAIFGGSVFALRLPSLLAVCGALALVWLLVKEFTKDEKTAFFTALAVAVSGAFATLARFGAGYAPVLCAVLASAYFAARFFSRGISSARVLKGGCNVLFSGVFASIAFAMDSATVFPIAGILVLLGAGMYRQSLAYKRAREKLGEEQADEARALANAYAYKNRVCYCFGALSLVACSFILIIASAVLSYTAIVKVYGAETGFGEAIWLGVSQSFKGGIGEGASALSWLLPLGKYELFDGAVRFNEVLAFACPLAFLGVTARIVYGLVKKETDKNALRVRRSYFLWTGGLVSGLLFGLVKTQAVLPYAGLFFVSYLAFVPLLALAFEKSENKTVRVLSRVLLWAVLVGAVVAFGFACPVVYGI